MHYLLFYDVADGILPAARNPATSSISVFRSAAF